VPRRRFSKPRWVCCPACGRALLSTSFYEHVTKHLEELLAEGALRREVFDFGIEKREVWIVGGRYYLSPAQALLAALEQRAR
jgi:hypothetical protein